MIVDQTELPKYDTRIMVAGAHEYTDYAGFTQFMDDYMLSHVRGSAIFVTGSAARGASLMLQAWCEKRRKPLVLWPVDYKTYGRKAGFIRNEEMAKACTHAIVFFNACKQEGAYHAYRAARRQGCQRLKVLFDPKTQPNEDEQSHKTKNSSQPRCDIGFSTRYADLDQFSLWNGTQLR